MIHHIYLKVNPFLLTTTVSTTTTRISKTNPKPRISYTKTNLGTYSELLFIFFPPFLLSSFLPFLLSSLPPFLPSFSYFFFYFSVEERATSFQKICMRNTYMDRIHFHIESDIQLVNLSTPMPPQTHIKNTFNNNGTP